MFEFRRTARGFDRRGSRRMILRLLLGALLALLGIAGAAQADVDPSRADRFIRFLRASSNVEGLNGPLSFSSDGHRFVFIRGDKVMLASRRGTGWVYREIAQPRTATLNSAGRLVHSSPRISPDGRHLAFWSDASGSRQMWVTDLETGEARQVTDVPGGVRARSPGWDDSAAETSSFAWSPRGDEILFSHTVEAIRPQRARPAWLAQASDSSIRAYASEPDGDPLQDLLIPNGTRPYTSTIPLREQTHLHVVSLRSASVRQLTHGGTSFYAPIWSSRGVILAKGSDPARSNPISSAQVDLFRIDSATGEGVALTADVHIERMAQFSPDGSAVAFIDRERHLAYPKLCVIRIETSERECRQFDFPIYQLSWHGGNVLVSGFGRRRGQIHLVAVRGLRTLRSFESAGEVGELAGSVVGGHCLWIESVPESPTVLAEGCSSGPPRRLLASSASVPEQVNYRLVELSWPAADGETVTGILYIPQTVSGAGRPPVIFHAYPGTAGYRHIAGRDRGFLALGYAILKINSRPPHTWMNYIGPEAYTLVGRGPPGVEIVLDDVTRGLQAARQTGLVDVDRTCGYGFSNGGGVLAQIVTQTDILRCAVIVAPAHVDWESSFFDSNYSGMGRRWAGDVSPWEDPAYFAALSPLYRVDRVRTPTLIAIGGRDQSFVMGSIALYNGLRANGADTALLLYPDDGHNLRPEADADLWRRIITYLDTHLGAGR